MNAKSKFSIPILSGTRPEVGLFSATVAAPSLRNASNLVSGVAVSSYPMVTTSVTTNNSIVPIDESYPGGRYPGTNTMLADQLGDLQLLYTDAGKKTIQLDYSQDVTGPGTSHMMVEYLATGKLEGDIKSKLNIPGVFSTSTNSQALGNSLSDLSTELYDCSPLFNDVSGVEPVTAATQGASYQTGNNITARMVYFTDKDGIVSTRATGFVLGTFAINATGNVTNPIQTGPTSLLDNSIENIPVGGALTVEDGQVAALPTLISGGFGYPPNTGFPVNVKIVSQAPNPSSVSGLPGQGLVLLVSTNGSGEITSIGGINDHGSGYSNGDIVELIGPNGQGFGALVSLLVVITPSNNGTLATTKVTSQYRPGSGAPLGPYDSYTVESIVLPNGAIKNLALNSEENICQSKVPKTRIFTAGGNKAYYPQISSGMQPNNWKVGTGAALCANPALCLPMNVHV